MQSGTSKNLIKPALLESVLEQLGFSQQPTNDLTGLAQVYAAWCHKVPFDNVRKLIHIRDANGGTLPGNTATDFFKAWLKHRTGATCWAGNNALHALLTTLGFQASRGICTMLVAPHLPPNHGTVVVEIDGCNYWVDASILYEFPLLLDLEKLSDLGQLRFSTQLRQEEGKWYLNWLPINRTEGLDCRLDSFPASKTEFRKYHELTREWSPFNYELTVRKLVDDTAFEIANGRWIEVVNGETTWEGEIQSEEERMYFLVDHVGYSEEIASQIPPDVPTPSPPISMRGRREQNQEM